MGHCSDSMGQSTETAHLASLLAGQGSVQAQPAQSASQSAQSVTQPENGSASQRRLPSHHHHEEFLKVGSSLYLCIIIPYVYILPDYCYRSMLQTMADLSIIFFILLQC